MSEQFPLPSVQPALSPLVPPQPVPPWPAAQITPLRAAARANPAAALAMAAYHRQALAYLDS
ncbi:hypothetical protein GCM10027589_22180 [Actinocorallia lasiicapitis]